MEFALFTAPALAVLAAAISSAFAQPAYTHGLMMQRAATLRAQ